jgi:hypothetical protein
VELETVWELWTVIWISSTVAKHNNEVHLQRLQELNNNKLLTKIVYEKYIRIVLAMSGSHGGEYKDDNILGCGAV